MCNHFTNGKLNNCGPPYRSVGTIGASWTPGGHAYAVSMVSDAADGQAYAGGPPVRAADHPLADAKYVSLTTFRRTGARVSTPVWLAPSVDDPGVFTVITLDDTGKTKRLAHTDRVEVRPCDVRGRVPHDAPTYRGSASVVRHPEGVASVRRSVVAKYGFPARFSDLVDKVAPRLHVRRQPRAGILVRLEPHSADGDRGRAARPPRR
jgi:PPOX class probable F420-dependent enzyme